MDLPYPVGNKNNAFLTDANNTRASNPASFLKKCLGLLLLWPLSLDRLNHTLFEVLLLVCSVVLSCFTILSGTAV